MWQGHFNQDIESIGNTLGSLKESQEQVDLLLAFFVFLGRERDEWQRCCGAYSSVENYAQSITLA